MKVLRAILFVPAGRPALVGKAARGAASAVCIDLEDGVAPPARSAARAGLALATAELRAAGKPAMVRVNADLEELGADLAALPAEVDAVVLPKTGSLHQVALLGTALDRRFGAGGPQIVGLVESGADLDRLRATGPDAPHPRLIALAPGTEDLSADLGVEPDAPSIIHAMQEIGFLCRRWNLVLLGYPGSIALFRELERFAAGVRAGAAAGAIGGFAIHPAQIDVLHACFAPDADRLKEARAVVAAFEDAMAEGRGAISLMGRMIDRPVYERARALLLRG